MGMYHQRLSGVGFLLAAKSVFRFGDLKEKNDHKMTEYVMIGTLLSVTITLFIGCLLYTSDAADE